MEKFKVGDKVRVKKNLVVGNKYGGITLLGSMKNTKWVYTVVHADRGICGLENEFGYHESMLEKVEEKNKKMDIEMGQAVIFNHGGEFGICLGMKTSEDYYTMLYPPREGGGFWKTGKQFVEDRILYIKNNEYYSSVDNCCFEDVIKVRHGNRISERNWKKVSKDTELSKFLNKHYACSPAKEYFKDCDTLEEAYYKCIDNGKTSYIRWAIEADPERFKNGEKVLELLDACNTGNLVLGDIKKYLKSLY